MAISYCNWLAALPPLPANLQTLDVGGCRHLTALPSLPENLQALDAVTKRNGYLEDQFSL